MQLCICVPAIERRYEKPRQRDCITGNFGLRDGRAYTEKKVCIEGVMEHAS